MAQSNASIMSEEHCYSLVKLHAKLEDLLHGTLSRFFLTHTATGADAQKVRRIASTSGSLP